VVADCYCLFTYYLEKFFWCYWVHGVASLYQKIEPTILFIYPMLNLGMLYPQLDKLLVYRLPALLKNLKGIFTLLDQF